MTAKVLWLIKGLGLGGAERLVATMASRFDREAFRIEVAYLLPWKDAVVPELESQGIEVTCLRASRTFDLRWIVRLRRLMRRGRFDIVHTHSPVPAVAARLLAPRDTRFVHTEHNVWERYRAPTRLANAGTYARNAHAYAVSDGVAASIKVPRWAPGTPPSMSTLLHGVEPDGVPQGPEARQAARATLGVGDGPVIGTVANFTPKKDQATLLDAFDRVRRSVPDVTLVLIGSGPLDAELRQEVDRRGMQAQVTFLGSRDDVPEILPAFDVFTLSSRYEGLPISLLEAMAAEVVPVVTRVGGIPEAVTDGLDGRLVPPGDAAALATALAEVLSDEVRRDALASAARERVVTAFSIDGAIDEMADLYGGLLS